MESKLIKSLIVLGVPGVSLGMCYLLLKTFSFNFETITAPWAGAIAVIFLLVVGSVTIFALHRWSPRTIYDGGTGIAFSVPVKGAKFESIASAIVASENKTIEFEGFTNNELNSNVNSQDLSAPSTDKILLLLRGLTNGKVRKYSVNRSDFGGYILKILE